ncbi:nucleotide disphospho-sugar-binding domain-containing protein, partial [Nocardiopsis sp. MG754419]|uniref:nucleotide disphospho-sugar-binding domain-containing protein n=1 Tax=Nocardiopsis sp. MG754419 TaxID=2259865 RepID=UPI0035B37115|nr:hypothetical protein [Nocardiopsis sp. MG754419]
QRDLPELPDNVRVVEFAPLHALLPTCSAVVHHGGWGTVCSASYAGTPQVILPQQLDAPFMADRIAGAGAGLSLPPARALDVGEAVSRLLSEEGFARGAERLRADMAAMPAPNDVVPEIERLVEHHRP